ncbi:hypothetical protein TIFTF001_054507, partial [Ficus carica]
MASLSGGRTPKQSIGAFVVLSLASHNVGPGWDELNPDDLEEDRSECLSVALYFRCSFVGRMIRIRGVSSLGRVRVRMNGIEVVVYLRTPIPEVLRHRRCAPPKMESLEGWLVRYKIQYAREWIPTLSMLSSREPSDLERVSALS